MHQNKTAKRSPQKGRASLTDIIANKTSQHCEAFGIDGSNDLSQKIARALKTITVYDFYDEIFQKRYIAKGSGKDAEVQKAQKRAVWAFATGTVAGLILAIIALALPSPVEMLAFSIHSRFILICLEYIPYVMMFLCATSISFGIIGFMNRHEDMEAFMLERKSIIR